jgi:photosystem II cytochrome c550
MNTSYNNNKIRNERRIVVTGLSLYPSSLIVAYMFDKCFVNIGYYFGNSCKFEIEPNTDYIFQSEKPPLKLVKQLSQNNSSIVVLTPEQVKRGKRLFVNTCSICHTGGITKTNPNVGLDSEALSLATPTRNTIEGLVDYLKNPTTFDGLESIAEIHPSIRSADIFPKMRTLTEDDLYAIAGHILVSPKILAEKWGGGKIYY